MCMGAPESTIIFPYFGFVEGSFLRFLELWDILDESPRVSAITSLLSFNLFLRSILSLSNVIFLWSLWRWRTMIAEKIFTDFVKLQVIVSENDIWFSRRLQKLPQALLRFLRIFGFTWIWLLPLSCQVLSHDSVSVIVSRFTIFTGNLVICCYQVVKMFCSRYNCVSTCSVRSPCYLEFLAKCRSFDPSRSENTVLIRSHFSQRSWSWFTRRTPFLYTRILSSTRFFVNSFSHADRSRNGSPREISLSSFLFLLSLSAGSDDGSRHTWLLILSLGVVAGRNVEITTFWHGDLEMKM